MLLENTSNDNIDAAEANEVAGSGVIIGSGTIYNRIVFVYAQDFTVHGGSLDRVSAQKICYIMDMAAKVKAPLIGMNDSGGARIQEGVDALYGYGEIFKRNVEYSGVIPQISLIMGPCAGGAAYSPALTDFIFMIEDTSTMFITGPSVVAAVTDEHISAEELGGSKLHSEVTGLACKRYKDDVTALLDIRNLISYLPSAYNAPIPSYEVKDKEERLLHRLDDIIPEDPHLPYDMKEVISEIVDDRETFELFPDFAANIITAFARINGSTVGIVANQPLYLAGCLDIKASVKGARFVRFCDAYNIPIITFTDVPGFLPGSEQEHNGIIRHGAKLIYAYAEATVPKITFITGKAYGGAYIVMGSKHLYGDFNFAWVRSEIAVMGAAAAANILHSKAGGKEKSVDIEKLSSPLKAAQHGYIDEIISPRYSRLRIINCLKILKNKKPQRAFNRKHDNLPL